MRSLGCSRDEITALGRDSVYWRGAIYNAVPTEGLKSVDCVDSVVAVRQALEDFQTSISAGDPPADEQWLDWRPLYELARHEP